MPRVLACLLPLLFVCGCNAPSSATAADSAAPADMATAPPDLAARSMCTAAVEQVLAPIDKTATGQVTIISDTNGVRTVYIDASAGGINNESTHPRIYVSLATATRVALTDNTARTSTDWDLALKRPVIFTNDGDGGPGAGGAASLAKPFDQVTAADAMGLTLATESFVDANCNPMLDPIGSVLTSMSDWYAYDPQTNILTPKAVTWIVRGATGKLYKLEIDDYYAYSDGTTGAGGGNYKVRIGAL